MTYAYNNKNYPTHKEAKDQMLTDIGGSDIVSVNEDTDGHSLYRTSNCIFTIDKIKE